MARRRWLVKSEPAAYSWERLVREGREVVGVAKVARAAYPEPGAGDPRWVAVDLVPVKPLARAVALAEIKADRALAGIPLVRQGRLSVMPLEPDAFDRIVELAQGPGRQRSAAPRR